MAVTGHGATFTFDGSRGTFSGGVTRISVDSPTAEIVDATGAYDPGDYDVKIPTGGWRGGSITVEFIAGASAGGVQPLVRGVGTLSFTSNGLSVSRQVILESASVGVSSGDVVRGSLKFVMTDWYGT